ncbi:hypothetical protein C7377_1686 [Balneicella halophila]|uniref:Secreted protein n=1 Tax=Balneicella halophila TaxID=1537566 RepID=A0A7L4UQM6_BALHA|nr:SIMPL domain-containing protein [Balneicella halophila]PVX50040.1 hypothetical protein C7377_1686 [Balneicella halophila]
MKRIAILILLLTSLAFNMNAQTQDNKNYIEVTGDAELKVTPDEIYLSIALNEKDVKDRRSLDELEGDVIAVMRKLNIPTDNLSIAGANSDMERAFWTGKKIYARKNYILKLTNANIIGQLLRELEKKGISNVNLARVDNSQMEKYRKEVKIMAMKAAKDKANYLLEAIGEKVGKPLLIQERNYRPPFYRNTSNVMMMKSADANGRKNYELDFQDLTLKYEIFARFEIAE